MGEASDMRDRALGRRAVSSGDCEPDAWPVAVVPKFRARRSRLPRARHRTFAANLAKVVHAARTRHERGERLERPAAPRSPSTLHAGDVQDLFGAVCGACRGFCCIAGGEHAFLTAETMLARMQRTPGVTDGEIVADYLARLPERTLTGGCVFQGADGCALPRDMRGDTCNRHLCTGLRALQHALEAGSPVRAYVAHQEGDAITSGRFLPVLPG